ncbi:MAG: class I tRNA ligase family protein [Coprobacillus cateniformis]
MVGSCFIAIIESGKLTDNNDHSLDFVYHQTVKKVTNDYETLGFNTAISQMMIFVNEAYKAPTLYRLMLKAWFKNVRIVLHHIFVKKCGHYWDMKEQLLMNLGQRMMTLC